MTRIPRDSEVIVTCGKCGHSFKARTMSPKGGRQCSEINSNLLIG